MSQVMRSRWFVVFASMVVMAASGAGYIFALYSKELRSTMGYNQQTLNTLSFFKDLGASVGIVSGLVHEVAPTWALLLIGAGMNLWGYLMIYLALTARIKPPHLRLMCLYICVGTNGLTFAQTGALVSCVKNFPESRGIVLGLVKGFIGLSGAIFTELYLSIYGDNANSLVLLIAWLPAVVYIIFMRSIRVVPYAARRDGELGDDKKPFFQILYISIILAAFLVIMIILQKMVQFSHAAYIVGATALLIILFLPLGVVIRTEYKAASLLQPSSLQEPPSITIDAPAASGGILGCFTDLFKPPTLGDDYSILQALVSLEMLVLFAVSAFGIGGTVTAIDNMAQIGQSLGYHSKSIKTFVSLVGIWNFAGRVGAGYLSDVLLLRYRFPRPLALTAVLLVSCFGHLLIAFGVPQSLYAASVIIGFCLGAQFPLLLSIISEVFGLKYYSTLFNFGSMSIPLGSYLLNVRVVGHMYDAEAAKQHGGAGVAGAKICMGVACFKHGFLIITAVTFVSALVSLVLYWRTKGFYKDIEGKFKVTRAMAADGRDRSVETVMGMEASALPDKEQEARAKTQTRTN
ncbi:hypothetical protein ACP70R_033081 [Stipagrostis hirtigluma subsp. patula]